ncbi:MAG: hypothetical protein C0481_08640 [Phenylobacterium sp.]|uniref:hypothetical protein n=1 Tax=Phenylobacterium sp. TaxID=1871053 RepID=UPI0025E94B64|nr:hypothetical protein [Phenylobacterium sp.]MBA4011919.1 hypothetical protein [Phenylobacterium sp.]
MVDADITWDEPLIVEDDVWVAHNVVILPSCKFMAAALDATLWWELDTPELRRLVQSQGDMVNNPSVAALEAWRRNQPISA